MSDLIFNIRFGKRHFQIGKSPWRITFSVNKYFVQNPPVKWFEVYTLFGKHF